MGVPSIFADVGWYLWIVAGSRGADPRTIGLVPENLDFRGVIILAISTGSEVRMDDFCWYGLIGYEKGLAFSQCLDIKNEIVENETDLYTGILEANDYQEKRVTELCKMQNVRPEKMQRLLKQGKAPVVFSFVNLRGGTIGRDEVEDDCNAKLVARLLTTLGLKIPTSIEMKAALENAWAKTEGDLHRALMSHVMDRSRRNFDARSGSKNMALLKKLVNTLQEEKDQERKIPLEDPNRLPTREWGDFSEGSGPAEYLDDEDMADHAQEGGEEEEMDNDAIIPDPDDPTGFPKTPCKPHAPPAPVDSDTEAAAAEEALAEEAEKNADAQKECFGAGCGFRIAVPWRVQQQIRNAASLSEVQTDEAVQGRGNPRGRGRGGRGGRGSRGGRGRGRGQGEDDDLDAEDEKATDEVLLEEQEDKLKNKGQAKAKGQAKKEPKAKAKGQAKKEPKATAKGEAKKAKGQDQVETPGTVEEDCPWLLHLNL
ncbi:WRAP53 [Symbiodinium sp. CCMP2592]|nr:WRAP53 [Symbiodinium sp. CCMP2592]CAE7526799.1 WRAP53 [Symbiodinium sp. CCMP2592]